MAATNGFFGQIQGPFQADVNIFEAIQAQCKNQINYITKIGIHYPGSFDFDLNREFWPPSTKTNRDTYAQVSIKLNGMNENDKGIDFQIGKTRMLELEDVQITSIIFSNTTDSNVYIDYQYK